MEANFKEYFSQTRELLKSYTEKRLELLRLQTTLTTSKAMGIIFSLLIIFFILLIVIIFGGMWLSFWLAEQTGSYATGFGISTGIFFFILLLALIFRKKIIQTPIADTIANEIEDEDDINLI